MDKDRAQQSRIHVSDRVNWMDKGHITKHSDALDYLQDRPQVPTVTITTSHGPSAPLFVIHLEIDVLFYTYTAGFSAPSTVHGCH